MCQPALVFVKKWNMCRRCVFSVRAASYWKILSYWAKRTYLEHAACISVCTLSLIFSCRENGFGFNNNVSKTLSQEFVINWWVYAHNFNVYIVRSPTDCRASGTSMMSYVRNEHIWMSAENAFWRGPNCINVMLAVQIHVSSISNAKLQITNLWLEICKTLLLASLPHSLYLFQWREMLKRLTGTPPAGRRSSPTGKTFLWTPTRETGQPSPYTTLNWKTPAFTSVWQGMRRRRPRPQSMWRFSVSVLLFF